MAADPVHAPERSESLAALLGGRGGAIDATLPAVAFGLVWVLWGQIGTGRDAIVAGSVAALAVGAAVAVWRWRRGATPRAVVLGLAAVAVGALIAIRTGRASDFFLLQLLSNAASAAAWAVSIVLRWPLLGVVVGGLLGQRFRWRRDPDLLRAYRWASWIWVAQYLVRVAVFVPLWLADEALALTAARVVLTWPLVAACLAISAWVLKRTLPADHPGIRHPRT